MEVGSRIGLGRFRSGADAARVRPAEIALEAEDSATDLPVVANHRAADDAVCPCVALGDGTAFFDTRAAPQIAEMPADIEAGPIVGRNSRGQRRSLCDHRRQREIRGEGNGRTDCGKHCRKRDAARCRCQKPGRHDLVPRRFAARLRGTLEAAAKRNLDASGCPVGRKRKMRLVFSQADAEMRQCSRMSGALMPASSIDGAPNLRIVMAGLVPAIHVFGVATLLETWMPGIKPGMTAERPCVSIRHGRACPGHPRL